MQRILLICRHAATQDPFPLQPDFERELTQQGIKEAQVTGQWLRDKFVKVDALLSSPARRTTATSRMLAARLYFAEDKIQFIPELYNCRESQLLHSLSQLPSSAKTVLLVAHNPGVTRLARELTGQQIPYLETANTVAVSLELVNWEDIYTAQGALLQFKPVHS